MKMCIVWLIGLFAWNALFGAFGGLLLCIHQDFGVHMDEDAVNGVSCSGEHEHSNQASQANQANQANQASGCVGAGESCVDIELLAEQLPPARLQSEVQFVALLVLLTVLIDHFQVPEPSLALVYHLDEPCASPQADWLTDVYLQTTVLRV